MDASLRRKRVCGIALLVGAALLAAFAVRWMAPQLGLVERFTRPAAPAPRPNHIIARLEDGSTLRMPEQSLQPHPPVARHCAFEPLLPPANRHDGRYRLAQAAEASLPDAGAYRALANRAAAAGRTRDSEVALIMACRLSTGAGTAGSLDLAAVQQQLARLYSEQAHAAGNDGSAAAYRERSELLLERSQAREAGIWKYRADDACPAASLPCS